MNPSNQWNQFEDDRTKLLNGRCVAYALNSEKCPISESDLLKCFISSNDDDTTQNAVRHKLKRILTAGVRHGFIINRGSSFALPSLENLHAVDGDEEDSGDSVILMEDDVSVVTVSSGECGTGSERSLPLDVTGDEEEEDDEHNTVASTGSEMIEEEGDDNTVSTFEREAGRLRTINIAIFVTTSKRKTSDEASESTPRKRRLCDTPDQPAAISPRKSKRVRKQTSFYSAP